MRNCSDGYPSCRQAEATGAWCKTDCVAALEKELAGELKKRDALNEKHIAFTSSEGRTRARTTTHNANVGRVQDRINNLRGLIKAASVEPKPVWPFPVAPAPTETGSTA